MLDTEKKAAILCVCATIKKVAQLDYKKSFLCERSLGFHLTKSVWFLYLISKHHKIIPNNCKFGHFRSLVVLTWSLLGKVSLGGLPRGVTGSPQCSRTHDPLATLPSHTHTDTHSLSLFISGATCPTLAQSLSLSLIHASRAPHPIVGYN